jgi:hypothetical protein
MNVEDPSPDSQLVAGGFTNTTTIELMTSLDLGVFAQQVQTNSLAALQALYPNLQIATSGSVLTNVLVTNVNTAILQTTNGATQVATNFGITFPVTTMDYAVFLQNSLTNDAATLSNLYPGLIVTSEVTNWVVATNFIITAYMYLPPWAPTTAIPSVGFTTNYSYSFVPDYIHTFANLVVYSSTNRSAVTTLTIAALAPWSGVGAVTTNTTTVTTVTTNVSGDFYLLPTNYCGYSVQQTLTDVIATTNILATAVTNNDSSVVLATITYFTNHQLLVVPITCETLVTNYASVGITNFQYTFDNVVTNVSATNTLVTILTTNLATGVVSTNNVLVTNLLSGSIFIYPTNECGLSIIGIQSTNITASTNPPVIVFSNGVEFSQSEIIYSTNYTVRVNPVDCSAPGFGGTETALREGINQMSFARVDFDSLLGQFYAPLTNLYTMTAVQGDQPVVQTFRRVVRRPDVLFSAQDLNGGGASGVFAEETITPDGLWDTAHALTGLAGPGTITNQYVITFNKVGPFLVNVGSAFLNQANASPNFIWGSFDASTNAPIAYPSGTSIMQLENEVFMQITNSSTLPTGQEGVAYAVQLGGTGGTPPYTWSIASGSGGLPPGFNTTTATNLPTLPNGTVLIPDGLISGTPAAGSAGTYDVTIQMTDFGGDSVQEAFTLMVNP